MFKKSDIEYIYPLSPLQEGMLFHYTMDKNSSAYFEQITLHIHGEIDPRLVEESLNKIIEKYDILRTVFVYEKVNRPLQVVLKNRQIKVRMEDISRRGEEEKKRLPEDFKDRDKAQGFDLVKDMLMRVSIIKTAPRAFKLTWSFHHIIMDGWCIGIVMKDFITIYNRLKSHRTAGVRPAKPFRNYIRWLGTREPGESPAFWQAYLEGYEKPAGLPAFKSPPRDRSCKNGEYILNIDKALTEGMQAAAAQHRVTLNTLFRTLWGVLLQKYNNTGDVVYGAVVSGRPAEVEGIEDMVGLFINTVPVRIRTGEQENFSRLLHRTHHQSLQSRQHEYSPLADIQNRSPLKGKLLHHVIGFQNFPTREIINNAGRQQNSGFTIEKVEFFEQSNYDFNLAVGFGEMLSLRFNYNSLVYDKQDVENIGVHFVRVLRQVLQAPFIPVRDIELLSPAEKKCILYRWNDTRTQYPGDKTIRALFQEQAARTPDRIALTGPRSITYRRLNREANRLAWVLRQKGVGPDTLVGLLMERSPDIIVGILAILKAGGAYLPITPSTPNNRVLSMLEDARAPILLTHTPLVEKFPFTALQHLKAGTAGPVITPARQQVIHMDQLPVLDRSLVDYEKYHHYIGQAMVKHSIALQATCGCPFKCAYCFKTWPGKYVFRSVENIFNEVKLYYDMGVRRFVFIDDIFNFDRENSEGFFRKVIENELEVQLLFPSGFRGDILTPGYIDLAVRAGTVNFALALETASPRLQKRIKKNLALEKFRDIVQYTCETHPRVILELQTMHGLPGESEEEALMTLDFIKSMKWIDFPYINILKIFPGTEMEQLALQHGVSPAAIRSSVEMAYHQLPDTLPFDKSFTLKYQGDFLNGYFLHRERLLAVLPHQMKVLTEDEIVQKYNSYLPVEIRSFEQLLEFLRIPPDRLAGQTCLPENEVRVPGLNEKMRRHFPRRVPAEGALKVLLLDLSIHFSEGKETLYDVVEPPLGLLSLLTYLNRELGPAVQGKIARSRIDFADYAQLKMIIDDFKPGIIGIRSLTFYSHFFHKTIALIRQWGIHVPVIAGGPMPPVTFARYCRTPT